MGKGKKGKKRGDDDDWEDDIAEIAKESGIDLQKEDDPVEIVDVTKKKGKKKKSKTQNQKDSDDEVDTDSKKQTAKHSFNALMVEGSVSEEEHLSSENEDIEGKENQQGEQPPQSQSTTSSKAKKKKTGKKKIEDDEDLDAILADIEGDAKKEEKSSKKGKKKGHQKEPEVVEESVELDAENIPKDCEADNEVKNEEANILVNEDDQTNRKIQEAVVNEEGPTVKTAAQKRAEKKEREKQKKKKEGKKKTESKQEKAVDDSKDEDAEKPLEESESGEMTSEAVSKEVKKVDAEELGSEEEAEEGEKKKKKKKKKKGKEEEEKKKGKKPGKAAIKQMQEALEKLKLEEERLRQEEDAKQKALEEAEALRLEQFRLEQEKKEKKKLKEKEKKARLKKEGKLLTAAQKKQKQKAQIMLEEMKQLGIAVPSKESVEQRKKVQYVKKKKNQQLQSQTSTDSTKEAADTDRGDEKVQLKPTQVSAVEGSKQEEETKVATSKAEKEAEDEELPDSWEEHGDEVNDGAFIPKKSEDEKEKEIEKQLKGASEPKPAEPIKEDEDSEKSDSDDEEEDEEESSEEETDSSEEEYEKLTPEKIKERARNRIMKRRDDAEAKRSVDHLRCPVICVLGHVDTGKTKILDKIRHTNVQDGEAGGITQQIGATMVPLDAVKLQTKMVKEFLKFDLKLPGLLIIDTPGHESFSNLRTRGSSLCDMAILVVDIMHGLEPQTIESINLLRKKHTPFIVALNKIDRLFEWKRGPASQVEDTIKKQKKNTKIEFEERAQHVIGEFAEQGLNAELFYKNVDEKNYISLVPTSAHSGDGMGDLIASVCRLTQTRLAKKLAFSDDVESTVMEVKALPGLGTTVDAILVNGKLREGDTIVTGGIDGPVVTQIRAILTPQPLRELRVKSNYIQHKELNAAQGCKITGKDLEKVMAGAPIFVAEQPDEIETLKDEVNEIVRSSLKSIKLSERGVYVQASTLGSLEALLEFLKTSKIPYSGVNIGPVHKKDVMKTSVMLEHEPLYAVVLAFDVKVERDAQDLADKEGIKIFTADIIYHLFDKFTAYTEDYKEKLKDKHKNLAVFPSKLRVLPQHIFNSRDPIVIGVHIEAGTLRLGCPLTVPSKEFCDIGIVTGIEANHKNMDKATAGQEVCVKIEPTGEAPRMYGRHFTDEDTIMSKISRESIDVLKSYFRDEMTKLDWQLIIEMKKVFDII